MKLQEKAKAENKEEVRSRKDKEREQLVNYLNCKWQYANNTAYKIEFRKYKLIQMINEITYFLQTDESGPNVITHEEQFLCLSLIRAISYFIAAKSVDNKRQLVKRLKDFTKLNEGGTYEQ